MSKIKGVKRTNGKGYFPFLLYRGETLISGHEKLPSVMKIAYNRKKPHLNDEYYDGYVVYQFNKNGARKRKSLTLHEIDTMFRDDLKTLRTLEVTLRSEALLERFSIGYSYDGDTHGIHDEKLFVDDDSTGENVTEYSYQGDASLTTILKDIQEKLKEKWDR